MGEVGTGLGPMSADRDAQREGERERNTLQCRKIPHEIVAAKQDTQKLVSQPKKAQDKRE